MNFNNRKDNLTNEPKLARETEKGRKASKYRYREKIEQVIEFCQHCRLRRCKTRSVNI